MLDTIKLALQKGKIERAKELLKEYFSNQHYQDWLKSKKNEYNNLYPEYKNVAWLDLATTAVRINYAEKYGLNSTDSETVKQHFKKQYDKTEETIYDITGYNKIDYSNDENYLTFDEWLNEEKAIQEEIVDEDGIIVQPEIKEKIRPYIPPTDDYLIPLIDSFMKPYRFQRLEKIFSNKTLGLKKLAIDKDWMTNAETINDQYRVYEEMYKNALKGYYDDATNQAIIQANETAKQLTAPITLLLNTVRSKLQVMIENDESNIDELLKEAENISLSKSDLTPEKIQEIKDIFGV